jgi:hypothetical protein
MDSFTFIPKSFAIDETEIQPERDFGGGPEGCVIA